jgi:thiosulfate reductase/polysulfide reductase chain A
MKSLTRKDFLKLAGVTAGAVTGVTKFASATPATVKGNELEQVKSETVYSTCHMCGGGSGIACRVVNGRLVKINPNPYNPNNFSNISTDFFENVEKEGTCICAKGNAGIATLYDRDRLQKPLRRTNPHKGIDIDPGFKEISWEEAYDEIVRRLKALRDNGESHKLLSFTEDASFTNLQGDFYSLFGTPNFSMHSNLCDVSRKASYKMAMGDERPLMDAIQSKYILLFGWNPLSATKWSHLPRIITRGIENGAKLVVVDPYLSYTANKAHEWIPIRPSTDGAMALAMGHVIIRDKLYDEAFINEWTVGFEQYAEYVKDKTPKWAEKITTVPAETIERIAIEFATTKPAVVDVWSGPGHHSNGVQGGRAIALLAALVGGYDRPGTLMIPDKKGNKHIDVHPDEIAKKTLKEKRFDQKELYPFGHGSGVYCQAFFNLAEGKGPYKPKMAMIIFQNPMMAAPGTKTVEKGLQSLEFVVVNDIFLSETALMADIVLPGTTYLERYELCGHWVTWPALGLRQPVVKPIFGQPTEYEFVTELGRRLGLKEADGEDFFWVGHISQERIEDKTKWYEEYLSKELKEGEPKITLDELKKLPGAVWVSKKGTRYEKYKDVIPPEKLADAIVEGNLVHSKKQDGTKDKQIGMMKEDGTAVRGFFTPSGKVEFYNAKFAEKKDAAGIPVNSLPVYEPRDWQPDANYPFYLINWKEASHTHTRTQNNAYLMELKSDSPLMMNIEAAKQLGMGDGDSVWVESVYGKIKAMVKLTQGIHPEVVGLQHGFGHWALGSIAKGRGSGDSTLRPCRAEPLSGQAMNKQCCVKIYKA